MTPPSERIRRILSDALPRERARALRERLRALGLERTLAETPRDGSTWTGADDERPLEEQVDGVVRDTPLGSFLYAERRVPLATRHGAVSLADARTSAVALRGGERGPAAAKRLLSEQAAFLDTETTGLAGGTGTVAFLVGAGSIQGDDFLVRQYCMRDYPEEPALLHALSEDLGDAPLVTFNGRSFDWPLLVTRWKLHRTAVVGRAHLDLLPLSRRLWVDSVPSHTLAALEEHVLGLTRENDLPGWRIPQAYFEYLRTGRPGLIALAFQHNVTDIVSMLALLGLVAAILDAPADRRDATARDLHGTARLLLDLGEEGKARRCLEAGVQRAKTQDGVSLRRLLGHLCRRSGDYDLALEHWQKLARTAPTFDLEAFEQVAKLYEHRRREFDRALGWVEEALRHVDPGSKPEEALRHREARLRRRMGSG